MEGPQGHDRGALTRRKIDRHHGGGRKCEQPCPKRKKGEGRGLPQQSQSHSGNGPMVKYQNRGKEKNHAIIKVVLLVGKMQTEKCAGRTGFRAFKRKLPQRVGTHEIWGLSITSIGELI